MKDFSWLLTALVLLAGCRDRSAERASMVLATTTSTRDSGLLDALLPAFEQQQRVDVKVVAVGSGQAIEIGRRGDADVLVTHAPELEHAFVEQGHGVARRPFMRNEFVIVGPAGDPAGIAGHRDAAEAMRAISEHGATFVSRGDQSGTHLMEQALWKRAGVTPAPPWYVEAGTGMAATLRMAHEKGAYTLTDRGTYLTLRRELDLPTIVEGDPALDNVYSVIVVDPNKHPHVQAAAPTAFAEFLLSVEGQSAIAEFGVEKFGQPIFFPLRAEAPATP